MYGNEIFNITYLIGNGFDINLGLQTDFKSFLKYYLSHKDKDDDKDIQDFKNDIDKNIETWSNLEREMGIYSGKVEDLETYNKCMEHLESILMIYLEEKEEYAIDLYTEENICKFWDAIEGWEEIIPKYGYGNIFRLGMQNIEYSYKFISFNYTNILDNFIDKKVKKIWSRHEGDYNQIYVDEDIIHIHGDINNPIVGVNDNSQIANSCFIKKQHFREDYIKEQSNKRFAPGRVEEVENILNLSNIIFIYGVSFGETDKRWWDYIVNLVRSERVLYVIIYEFICNAISDKKTKKYKFSMREQRNIEDNLYAKLGILDEEAEKIREKIIIKPITKTENLFKLNSIKDILVNNKSFV